MRDPRMNKLLAAVLESVRRQNLALDCLCNGFMRHQLQIDALLDRKPSELLVDTTELRSALSAAGKAAEDVEKLGRLFGLDGFQVN